MPSYLWVGVPGVYWQGVPNDHVCPHRMYLQSLLPPVTITARTRAGGTGFRSKLRTNERAAAIARRADQSKIRNYSDTRASKQPGKVPPDPQCPADIVTAFFAVIATRGCIHPPVSVCVEAVLGPEVPRFTLAAVAWRDYDVRCQTSGWSRAVVAPGPTTLTDHS